MHNLTLRHISIGWAAMAMAVGGLAASGPAAAEVSFKGKTITMIIGYRPGGGTDAVGRLTGKYLAQYMPGKPQIIFRNMPGGGGITSMNYFANQAKRDGSTITAGSSTQPDPLRFRRKSAKYDPLTFLYIGGIARGSSVMMINPATKSRLLDRSKKPVIMGAVDGTRSSMQVALWGAEYLGWNIKWVIGYPGTAEIALALQRGEVDMSSTANLFLIKELINAKKAVPLVQSGMLVAGKLVTRSEFPDVPIFTAMVRSKITDPIAKKAFAYWEGINALDKWLALPPKTPAAIVKTYRAAFVKAVKDKEFLALGRKMVSQDFAAILPQDQTTMIMKVAGTPNEALAYIKALKKKNGLPVAKVKVKLVKATATLDKVKRGGRVLMFKVKGKDQWTRVSSSRTKVKINGKESLRKHLKAGMTCKLNYRQGKTAKSVDCR